MAGWRWWHEGDGGSDMVVMMWCVVEGVEIEKVIVTSIAKNVNDGFLTVTKKRKKGKSRSTNGGLFDGQLVKQNVSYEPKASSNPLKAIVPPASLRRSPNADEGVNITVSNSYAALDEEIKEVVENVYNESANLLKSKKTGVFAVDTLDLADVEWSPDDSAIVIWDSPLEYKVLIYSLDGRYDQMLIVLNHLTWKVFAEFTHLATARAPCSAAVFKEVDEPYARYVWNLGNNLGWRAYASSLMCLDTRVEYGPQGLVEVRYDIMELLITLPFQKPPADKPNPKQGIEGVFGNRYCSG
nr:hypothetical protein [Tanacetum cinerariifolium]